MIKAVAEAEWRKNRRKVKPWKSMTAQEAADELVFLYGRRDALGYARERGHRAKTDATKAFYDTVYGIICLK